MKTKIPLSRCGRKKRKMKELILLTTIFILVVLNVRYAIFDIKKQIKKVNTISYAVTKFNSYNFIEKTVDGIDISNYAIKFKGNPYVHGGTSLTKGADCSGFTQSIYKHFDISIPRTVEGQSKVGKKVSFDELKEGDLVFYSNGDNNPTHVALYIGNDKIIHASTPVGGIKITTVHIMRKVTARRRVKE